MSVQNNDKLSGVWFKRWMMIGSFERDSDLERDFSLSEVSPNKVYSSAEYDYKWEDISGPIIYFSGRDGGSGIRFAASYVYARQTLTATLAYASDSEATWYINGQKYEEASRGKHGEYSLRVKLRHGWNLLMCRLDHTRNDLWGFAAGLADVNGDPLQDILHRTAFILPDDTDTHMFGRNPDEGDAIIIGRPEDEVHRSKPDIVVYVPKEGDAFNDGDNEHFLVVPAVKSEGLLAFWTQGKVEPTGDNHIVMARSLDGGETWSAPECVVGTHIGTDGFQASWGFPAVADNGRLYCFYTKSKVGTLGGTTGILGVMQSDDEGETWQHHSDREIPTSYVNGEQPDKPTGGFIVWQNAIADRLGRIIFGYTQFNFDRTSSCHLMRFDNLRAGPEGDDIQITILPDGGGVGLPEYLRERHCSEPAITLLPDGRLFMVMRTVTGYIWYTVSDDDGHSWRDTEPLRYCDGGEKIKNPLSSSPLYRLEDGRFILLFYNNSYYASRRFNEDKMPAGMGMFTHRRPLFIALGLYEPEAYQPIRFGPAAKFLDNDGVLVSPKASNEIATYPSLTEYEGRRMLWYPDRKYYLLGKNISDDFLESISPQPRKNNTRAGQGGER